MLASDFVLGIGNRWANRHRLIDVYAKGRKFVHVDIEPTQIGRVFPPTTGSSPTRRRRSSCSSPSRERKAAGKPRDRSAWVAECRERKRTLLRKTNFENADAAARYQCLNRAFDDQYTCYVTTIGYVDRRRAVPTSTGRDTGSIRVAHRWTIRLCSACVADPRIVALSGTTTSVHDRRIGRRRAVQGRTSRRPEQFYLGLIRQQRGSNGLLRVARLRQCQRARDGRLRRRPRPKSSKAHKAIRVHKQEEIDPAISRRAVKQYQVPVVISDPRAGDKHRDGHRDRQRRRVRGAREGQGRRANRSGTARLRRW